MKIVIMRGIPGSGKSTEVERLSIESHLNGMDMYVFSADYYFSRSGAYVFDGTKLGLAHGQCLRGFATALTHVHDADTLIVVDNTNLTVADMNVYVMLAQAYGVPFEIRTLLCDPALAAARNRHGVPTHKVWDMHRRLVAAQIPKGWPQLVISAPVGT